MARFKAVDPKDLSLTCSQVKRNIINKIKKGSITKISKTQAFDMVAVRLGLASSRTLWKGERYTYLDDWYNKLHTEVTELLESFNSNNNTVGICQSTNLSIDPTDDISTVIEKLNNALALNKSLEEAIKVLRVENESLRVKLLDKYKNIDI